MLEDTAKSHRSWFGRGREPVELDGVTLFLGRGDAVLAFPHPEGDLEGAVQRALDAGAREIACWALAPDAALDARLSVLGFQDGWQPHWMGVDSSVALDESEHKVEETTACVRKLPYASQRHESMLGGDVHHFVVRDGMAIVGHTVLDVDGATGGVYDMGVAPWARRRGHGRVLALAALARAREAGCTSVTLNATGEGESVYWSAGFQSLGRGMTWWHFPGSR